MSREDFWKRGKTRRNMWNKAFTIAIIEKNPEKIGKLIREIPIIQNVNEAKKAQALIQEALKIIKNEQSKLRDSMIKNKKTRAFYWLQI